MLLQIDLLSFLQYSKTRANSPFKPKRYSKATNLLCVWEGDFLASEISNFIEEAVSALS